jgi:hypothetical protein
LHIPDAHAEVTHILVWHHLTQTFQDRSPVKHQLLVDGRIAGPYLKYATPQSASSTQLASRWPAEKFGNDAPPGSVKCLLRPHAIVASKPHNICNYAPNRFRAAAGNSCAFAPLPALQVSQE